MRSSVMDVSIKSSMSPEMVLIDPIYYFNFTAYVTLLQAASTCTQSSPRARSNFAQVCRVWTQRKRQLVRVNMLSESLLQKPFQLNCNFSLCCTDVHKCCVRARVLSIAPLLRLYSENSVSMCMHCTDWGSSIESKVLIISTSLTWDSHDSK